MLQFWRRMASDDDTVECCMLCCGCLPPPHLLPPAGAAREHVLPTESFCLFQIEGTAKYKSAFLNVNAFSLLYISPYQLGALRLVVTTLLCATHSSHASEERTATGYAPDVCIPRKHYDRRGLASQRQPAGGRRRTSSSAAKH